jgi:hypothetical protein
MLNIALSEILAKLPFAELQAEIRRYVEPMTGNLPDKRLRDVVCMGVQNILATETPVIAAMSRSASRVEAECWAMAKRMYRFLENDRFSHHDLYKGLYRIAQKSVQEENPDYVVVAIDPVNFEKPYTKKLEGVSTVYKSTPPNLDGEKRLAKGYPAITASVVNTRVPGICYVNWYSYKTADFISQNREVQRAIRTTRWVFPDLRIRFVMDSGGDDQKVFAWMNQPNCEFVIIASHLERLVEVYNDRLDRWETEHLQDLVDSVPWVITYQAAFHHAGKTRLATIQAGWFTIRLPGTHQPLSVLVAHNDLENRNAVLITNVSIRSEADALQIYSDWRLRGKIEHGYRFDQEQGLDVEDLRVQTVERMRRLFALVLAAAQFVFHLMHHWPRKAVYWLRKLGGKLGLKSDRDGPYWLLRGISAVFLTAATLSLVAISPFPHDAFAKR